jgi:hypothetical protein
VEAGFFYSQNRVLLEVSGGRVIAGETSPFFASMKKPLRFYPAGLLAASFLFLGLAGGCGGNNSSDPKPKTVKIAIRRLQTDGTNTMVYVQYRLLKSSEVYLERLGGNSDSYNGEAETGADTEAPTGEYSFRVWCPDVVTNPYYPLTPAPRGQTRAELLVNGQVKATLNLDAARPHFERDTCSRTVTVQVQ